MNVTFENVIQILEAADRIQATDMKKYALNLIVHHFPKVCRTTINSPVFPVIRINFNYQVARMPRIRSLPRELLLDVLEALADDMSDSKLQDLSCTSLNSDA